MKKISILEYGVKCDGSVCTYAIQSAIDECFRQGGGIVEIPEGVYMSGGIRLRSNVTLHLLKNAVLIGSRNPEDYYGWLQDELEPFDPVEITDILHNRAELSDNKERDYQFIRLPGSRWHNGLIRAVDAENIGIIGEEGSAIDGNDCFDELGEEHYRGPHAISLFRCKNIQLRGYSVQRSGNWAHNLYRCSQISMDHVEVLAGHDGIHLNACENIVIRNSNFYTGDDCVAGFANLNVLVDNCEINSACSGFRFGGANVMITNCHIFAPGRYAFRGSMTAEEKRTSAPSHRKGHRTNMLSAFTYFSDYSLDVPYQPGNIVISDTTVEGADKLLHYNRSGNEIWQSNRPLANIRFERITAKNLAQPAVLYGDQDLYISAEFHQLNLTVREGYEESPMFWVCNFDNITMEDIVVEGGSDVALIQSWCDGEIHMKNVSCSPERTIMIKRANTVFHVKGI